MFNNNIILNRFFHTVEVDMVTIAYISCKLKAQRNASNDLQYAKSRRAISPAFQ